MTYIPSNVAIDNKKEAVAFLIKNIKITKPTISPDRPAFIEIYHLRYAIEDPNGDKIVGPTER
jgi:hypothetical protein